MTVRFIPELAGITPYQPGLPIEVVQRRFGLERVVKLASNETPWSPLPEVLSMQGKPTVSRAKAYLQARHQAVRAAMQDAGIETADALYVGNMLSGMLSEQQQLGALIALLPILGAVVTGLGVMAIGFSGVGNAVKALGDVQKNHKKDTIAQARALRNAAESVSDAERSLQRTREDAAESAQDAARAVADAERAAADQIQSALRARADAERALADAQRDATEAQEALREARKAAEEDLEEAADRQRRNSLDIRQAQIDLFNAQTSYNATMSDPGATNLEREQSSINLGQARERLKELRDESEEISKELRGGVAGNAGVESARDQLAQAYEARADAARNLADAERLADREGAGIEAPRQRVLHDEPAAAPPRCGAPFRTGIEQADPHTVARGP